MYRPRCASSGRLVQRCAALELCLVKRLEGFRGLTSPACVSRRGILSGYLLFEKGGAFSAWVVGAGFSKPQELEAQRNDSSQQHNSRCGKSQPGKSQAMSLIFLPIQPFSRQRIKPGVCKVGGLKQTYYGSRGEEGPGFPLLQMVAWRLRMAGCAVGSNTALSFLCIAQ